MTRITAFRLASPNPPALAAFYCNALGFSLDNNGHLRLGPSTIELGPAQQAYPPDIASNDVRFQHLAIVVADMEQAYAMLSRATGWTPISLAGPERLPATSGGATAFKFRDRDGHPLELLCFASGTAPPRWQGREALFLGIDHSAITVSDATTSLDFYAELGFRCNSRQTNKGEEQARLDGLSSQGTTSVEVIGLSAAPQGPHLELLAYETPPIRPATALADSNTAATVTIMSTAASRQIADPDGHRFAVPATG